MSKELIDRIRSYAEGHTTLLDDPEVYSVVMNLPIVRELQGRNSQLKNTVAEMQEILRFLKNSGDSFCAMWDHFKEVMGQEGA